MAERRNFNQGGCKREKLTEDNEKNISFICSKPFKYFLFADALVSTVGDGKKKT